MKPFTLLIKPASADCNLRCDYCFYLGRCDLYPETNAHRMTEETLDRMISSYMSTEQPAYAFGWQGGEPTLTGLDFFKKVTSLQQRRGKAGAVVSNGLQTNATLIDDAFAQHLAQFKFLVGCSLDGPADVHDYYRKNAGGSGSHAQVLRGIDCLKRHNVEFNILTLVNNINVQRPVEIYSYLVENNFLFHQYIPCQEFDSAGKLMPFSIEGQQWGDFLCAVFDEWERNDTRRVSIRLFDSILTKLVDRQTNVCHMARNCCQYFVVEWTGDIYPCDFFVYRDLKLGNVRETSWDEALSSEKYASFGILKRQWNESCAACKWLSFCSGDCLKHRFQKDRDPRSLSSLCAGWKTFYHHAMPRLTALADSITRERGLSRQNASLSSGAPNRNSPCPCGSGRKFKHCCMARR